ncbi:hypothetical protein CEXT_240071 [Caerostris extrusa]|uniref:Uncharacterized protein n=1 Tax=Caerostris extrusa TaxID=172846 RepID=A0AAV4PWD1_CAEEX|nr:hypothetical protein CEXT_240071 [Caerostris extrusa]
MPHQKVKPHTRKTAFSYRKSSRLCRFLHIHIYLSINAWIYRASIQIYAWKVHTTGSKDGSHSPWWVLKFAKKKKKMLKRQDISKRKTMAVSQESGIIKYIFISKKDAGVVGMVVKALISVTEENFSRKVWPKEGYSVKLSSRVSAHHTKFPLLAGTSSSIGGPYRSLTLELDSVSVSSSSDRKAASSCGPSPWSAVPCPLPSLVYRGRSPFCPSPLSFL